MTSSKTDGKTRAADEPAISDVAELVQADREKTAALIGAYLDSLRRASQTLPRVLTLNNDERKGTSGRISADELEQLVKILDVVDAEPAVFSSLAAKDHGRDPKRVETEPSRHAIELLTALVPLVDELNTAARQASDLALRLGELVRSVTTPAYAIANANAPVNERLRAGIAPTNDYYRKRSQASKTARGPKKGGSGGSTP